MYEYMYILSSTLGNIYLFKMIILIYKNNTNIGCSANEAFDYLFIYLI